MKYYFSLLACLVSFIAHAQTTYSYRVEGELTDNSFNGKMLYIMRYDDNRYIDSSFVQNKVAIVASCVDSTKRGDCSPSLKYKLDRKSVV